MASRSSRPPTQPSSNRQNEYFVPRDGIDREVISADICRYLGNDALVRPGMYENPQNGQVTHGYYITAYRNLTTAMIEDLKADSARWENERRAQNSRHTSGVSYHQSETHQSRQHYGPSETPHQPDPYGGHDPKRAYPGSGAPGYSGAGPSYQSGPSQPQSHAYPGGGNYPGYAQSGQNPSADPRYASPSGNPMMPPPQPGYPQDPYVATGANIKTTRGYAQSSNDPYARSSAPPAQPSYATSGTSQPSYPGAPGYSYNQVPTSAAPGYASTMHPQDPFMGRGGQTGQQPQGYSGQAPQQPQYAQAQPQQPSHSERHRSSGRR
ncbi:hypothetical protein NLU13_0170 [Sarocladium strictum]|uniref:Transcription factor RfeG n=1 Tax=Sarocladium strictum TaxID=5046 RepID=A0AA39GNV6_SARSR|nr:hypothetical protein NLU13_0170 [Sarocladium strictum]